MATLKLYIEDRRTIWDSIKEMGGLRNNECNRICNAVFNGEEIGDR